MGSRKEKFYFHYSASLRIFGSNLESNLIYNAMGIEPTYKHKQGEVNRFGRPFEQDMWIYKVPVPEESSLDEHIRKLWETFKPHKEFLLSLKEKYTVDIFCGYISNCSHAGFQVSPESLEAFIELKVPFGVSVVTI